jgi:iron complex outermembrane receptor protein/vitamin B12 transporter
MQTLDFLPAALRRICRPLAVTIFLVLIAASSQAASVRGVVTDTSGAKVTGASISLVSNGQVVASSVSSPDGSFQLTTGTAGRFFLVVNAKSFRQLQTPDFYAGAFDSIERNLVLEPAWVRESIVVTDTGTPTPQPQTSSATTVLSSLDLASRTDLVSALRLMPGAQAVQDGQLGAQTSLFVRGGDSTANKILLDGVDATDLGGTFDFGPLSTTAVERAEVYRGPDSNLYGAGAGSGVVSLTTPHGTTSFPSLLFEADAGNLGSSREQLEVAGAHKKLDYLGAFSWLQTANDLPNDEYHTATTAANLGYSLNSTTQVRGTLHYGVVSVGDPNAWDFYQVADDATQKNQNLFISASIDNQTTTALHNMLRYGATRKREQFNQWAPEGICIPADSCVNPPPNVPPGNYYGLPVTIQGANGYSVTGQTLLDYSTANFAVYPSGFQEVNNRDALTYQGDYTFTPHVIALVGFHYEDERGTYVDPSYGENEATERTNYDYLASVHGDFKGRFFYTLGGSLERYSLFGTETSPRAGLTYYAVRPRKGLFSSTRILFNYGDGVREPALSEQFGSLYYFLDNPQVTGGQAAIQELHIGPLAAPATRTYEGGVEQAFWGQRILFRSSYFHNEFGREIESVGATLLPNLIPGLTPSGKQQLIKALGSKYNEDAGLYVNTGAFRAQGFETSVESGIGSDLFLRGGYTYLDAVVQHSFDSDNEALMEGYAPTYPYLCTLGTADCIAIGGYTPLVGARPFRRAPHTGYFTATYAARRFTGIFTSAFASRADDSTYLEGEDANGLSSLLLPNRDLDHGYAKLDLGESFEIFHWMDLYTEEENLMNDQHIAPIGYPSLPFTVRSGLRLRWGPGSGH